jgi:hypothetical protein
VPAEPGPAGSFLRLFMMADVNLMTLARSAERVAQNEGRPSHADDFLTVLLGTTVHEVLEHGQRQREGIHAEDRSRDNLAPALGTRPSARLRELRSFLTQSRFDPHLGGKMPDPRTPRLLTDLTAMVDSLYKRVRTELNNEQLLFMIDPQRGADWLQARRRLDEFIRGESRGPEALGELWRWIDRIPLSTDKRVRLDALLTRLASEPPPEVEHFDPEGAATNLDPDREAAAAEPAALAQSRERVLPVYPVRDLPMPQLPAEGESAETLKAAILDELIFSRVIRPGTRQALRIRQAINRLRRLRGTGPDLPPLTPRSVPTTQRWRPLDIRSLETDEEGVSAVRRELDGLRRRELARGRRFGTDWTSHVNESAAVLQRLIDEARRHGVADAESARILGWLRATTPQVNHEFVERMENMLKVAKANVAGSTIVYDAGAHGLRQFEEFCYLVPPERALQLNLGVATRVKTKAALEATGRPQQWNAQERAILQLVAGARTDALHWLELTCDFEEGHGLEQLFTEEDLANIAWCAQAIVRTANGGRP